MPDLDFSSDFGKRVEGQLETEQVVWLTTVSPAGQPQPSPVWFIWRDDHLVMFSQPNTPKVRNIRQNPKVAVSFNTDPSGSQVSVLEGVATLRDEPATTADLAGFEDYVTKYTEGIEHIGHTPESMLESYSQVVTIELAKLRGW